MPPGLIFKVLITKVCDLDANQTETYLVLRCEGYHQAVEKAAYDFRSNHKGEIIEKIEVTILDWKIL